MMMIFACPLFKLLNVNGTIGNHNPNVANNDLDLAAVTKQSNRGRLRKAISFRFQWNPPSLGARLLKLRS